MKKNAFTLVELLAVIIILAIIALIAFPSINKTIKKSKYKAAYNSAIGLIEAIDLYYSHNTHTPYKDGEIVFECDGHNCHNDSNETLSFKGIVPANGNVILYGDGSIKLDFIAINNDYCIYGNKDNLKVKHMNCNLDNIPGLYDENDNLVISWYELVDDYNFNVEIDYGGRTATYAYDENGDLLLDDGYYFTSGSGYKSLSKVIKEVASDYRSELNNAKITKLVVDPSVKKIGTGALGFLTDYYTNSPSRTSHYRIKEIVLPDGLKTISKYAFAYNYELTTLDIPNSVEIIDIDAFLYDKKLNNINISKNVKHLRAPSTKNAINITIDKDNPYYTDLNSNYIVYKVDNALVYMGNNTEIPDETTSIRTGAFPKSNPIKDLVIPSTVERIEQSAFENALKSITIPKETKKIVRNLSDYPFSDYTAKSLEAITIDSNNQYYSDKGSNVIYDLRKNKLTGVISNSIFPAGVKSIDTCDFKIISSNTIVIPASTEEITTSCVYTMNSSINIVFEQPTGWYMAKNYSDTSGEEVDFTKTTFQAIFNNHINFSRLKRNTNS